MLDDFIVRALLGGIGVALVAGPLGCFVTWRRMAYFGDSLAHSALLGIALGALLGLDLNLGIVLVCFGFAVLLVLLQRQRTLATDTLLGLVSHGALAFGMVALSFVETIRVDLMGYLFGDILAVTRADLAWIYAGGLVVLAATAGIWASLLVLTVSEELARAEGVPARAIEAGFMLLIAFIIAAAMKIAGILLITALLIIPAAAARRLAASPEAMAAMAAGLGAVAVVAGLWFSAQFDTPSGPSIVIMACVLFALALAATPASGPLRRGWRRST